MRDIVLGNLALRIGTAPAFHEGLEAARAEGRGYCAGYVNPHVYNLAAEHPAVGAFLEACDFACLDGIGAAFAARAQNMAWLPRLVMDQVFDAAVAAGKVEGRVLLLGLREGEIGAAAAALQAASPRLRVAAHHSGFLPMEDYARICRRHADADFILAGMGTPRSEEVLLAARRLLPRAALWHVGGGTLRNWAGTKRRAPRWASRLGLEWAHRVRYEPETRARYARGIPAFVWRMARDMVSPHPRRAGTFAPERYAAAPGGRSMA